MQKKPQPPFSIRARKQSFEYAFEGISSFFRSEPNAVIHLLITAAVIVLAIVLKVSVGEGAILTLAIGIVWVAELFNTAIEAIMDHLSPERHPAVKRIKDISSAAVLIAAMSAVIVGLIIFIPKFI